MSGANEAASLPRLFARKENDPRLVVGFSGLAKA
jgi:hypothetical protein